MSNALSEKNLRRLVQKHTRYLSITAVEVHSQGDPSTDARLTRVSAGSSGSRKCFTALPLELVTHIVLLLDILDIVKLQSVSRQLRDIICQSPVVQYTIECGLSGVVDGPLSRSVGILERLDAVKAWRKAWRRPSWHGQPTTTVTLCRDPALACTVSGSVHSDVNQNDVDGLEFFRVPSRHRRVSTEQWALTALPDWSDSYAFDPEQDLLVLPHHYEGEQDIDIMFFSCKTGEAHPFASTSRFRVKAETPINFHDDYWAFHIQVSGDFVGLLIYPEESGASVSELWIINWKTGTTLLDITTQLLQLPEVEGFALLDDARVLYVFNELNGQYGSSRLAVFDCAKGPAHRMDLKEALESSACLAFALPELQTDLCTISIEYNPHRRQMTPSELFKQRDTAPVILVRYESEPSRDDDGVLPCDQFHLLIPARVITSRLDDPAAIKRTEEGCIPWSEWREETRLIQGIETTAPMCMAPRVSGSRYLHLEPLGSAEYQAHIYDFDSIPALRKDIASGDATIVSDLVTLNDGDAAPWSSEMTTGAAYRKIETDVKVDANTGTTVFIMEDGIVVSKKADKTNYRHVNLDIYTI